MRRAGYQQALQAAGLALDPALLGCQCQRPKTAIR